MDPGGWLSIIFTTMVIMALLGAINSALKADIKSIRYDLDYYRDKVTELQDQLERRDAENDRLKRIVSKAAVALNSWSEDLKKLVDEEEDVE